MSLLTSLLPVFVSSLPLCSSLSSQSTSSSLTSRALDKQHFLNPLMIESGDIVCHEQRIYSHIRLTDGFLTFADGVNAWPPSRSQSESCFRWWSLKVLFTTTSSTCSFDVIPPGMTTRSVFNAVIFFFPSGVRWPLNASNTSIAPLLSRAPGPRFQTKASQSTVSSVVIQPLYWQWITNPLGKFSLGTAVCSRITYGGSYPPSAITANITVMFCFSFPVVLN